MISRSNAEFGAVHFVTVRIDTQPSITIGLKQVLLYELLNPTNLTDTKFYSTPITCLTISTFAESLVLSHVLLYEMPGCFSIMTCLQQGCPLI